VPANEENDMNTTRTPEQDAMKVSELIERLAAVHDHDLEIEAPDGGSITGIDLYEGAIEEDPYFRIASSKDRF
jgi:hypothetical protein